jgi:rhodanese-related sulfurtransferase
MRATAAVRRIPPRRHACQVPLQLGEGFVKVDASWGEVQPLELASGVRTIGELELVDHLERGLPVIDTRLEHFHRDGTVPGAQSISHEQIIDRLDELDPETPTVFFCNGPQCKATPDAIARLLAAGFPPASILYYRGGMHDWVTLGYPVSAAA